eukprot:CAMPEP_0201544976 /NCGR_PEP_ID=MMETSP0173_2-20130828/1579_1 /ASSEMBLY_ACC=CAM_ASM_000268 /TAXON_ID=218659 /ORGANISM="Vexillifera sp., Strain DIVA3 564/2" /LENGTH=466 /DNA_ID=CAMNT_0047953275 /DNA_START=23 /DNA_END=1423 /DNA_ORIENTATION=-
MTTCGSQVYSVPVVYQDLRREEALCQIFDALQTLNETMNGVFTTIETRVQKEQGRIDSLGGRLKSATAKVDHIEKSFAKKATKVISPYKYPQSAYAEYVPLHLSGAGNGVAQVKHAQRDNYNLAGIPSVPAPTKPQASIKKSSGIQVDGSQQDSTFGDAEAWEGLGRLPDNLPSVSSLLLFNTQENPYNVYVTLDNLAGVDVEMENERAKEALTEAPKTVAEGDALPELSKIEYGYKPVLGAVPEFDLPDQLPDLAMVADLSFEVNDLPDIAPSAESNLPELPSVDPAALDDGPPPPSSSSGASDVPPPPADVPPPPVDAPAPPPPPSNAPVPPTPPANAPVPPGPAPVNVPKPPQSRGGLLADIRKGHKNRLKSSKRSRKQTAKAAKIAEEKSSSAPVDIMSALATALNRRREGIGGKQKTPKRRKSKKKSKKRSKKTTKKQQEFIPPSLPASDDDGSSSDGWTP